MKDVIIVGGGLKGMLTARSLHRAGLKVMIIEQSELGRESSWAGGGLVSPLYPWHHADAVSTLTRYSQQQYPALCAELKDETGIDAQWINSGLLITETDEQLQAQQWAHTHGYPCEYLQSPAAVQTAEAHINPRFQQALYFPEMGQVRSPRLSAALRASLHFRPILISEHQPVNRLHIEDGRIQGVYLGNDLFSADKVILEPGAWSGQFPQIATSSMRLQALQGQSIMFKIPRGHLTRIIAHQGYYLIPRQDGRIVCGALLENSSMEQNNLERRTTAAGLETLHKVACDMVPELANYPVINHWSSLLSFTESGVPYIGEHPEIRGLYVNTGHGSSSMATGLASAQLLVDQVLGRESFTGLEAYRLSDVL